MIRPPKHFYEFDSFRIDADERRLMRDGQLLPLTPKVFDLLLLLVENRGHTLAKDEIMDCLWADSFTEENNLSRNVSMLRKVLGDDAHVPRFITTVPKRGYRFEAELKEVLEDDDTFTVERRTNFVLAFREQVEGTEEISRPLLSGLLTPRKIIASVAVAVLLAAAFGFAPGGWSSFRSDSSDEDRAAVATNAEAFDLYERGRTLWNDRSAAGLHEATLLLEQAVEKDPDFALGHAALADAYAFDSTNHSLAEGEAQLAMQLDPSLGQPYATIGFVGLFWDWKLSEAERHFKRAISLSPDYAPAHQWYALQLAAGGRLNEALAEASRALELEPDSIAINTDVCRVFYFLQRHDEAEAQCKSTLVMDANSYDGHQLLSEIYTAKGMYPEAVGEFFVSERLTVNSSTLPAHLQPVQEAFERGGIRAFWKKLIEIRQVPVEEKEMVAVRYYALLGDRDATLRGLKRAYEKRDFGMIMLSADPVFREYYDDPELNSMFRSLIEN
ncbi:MAG: winged helix-turn-helix domain-containing protein [Pyrinomonadaceae bacterium]